MATFPTFIPPSKIHTVIGISRSTALRLEADPSAGFPVRRRITPGGHLTGWILQDLLDWAATREKVR